MSLLDRFKPGLSRTRKVLNAPVEDLVRGRRDPADFDAVEEALLAADLGLPATREAMELIRARSREIAEGGAEAMRAPLPGNLRASLDQPPGPRKRIRPGPSALSSARRRG